MVANRHGREGAVCDQDGFDAFAVRNGETRIFQDQRIEEHEIIGLLSIVLLPWVRGTIWCLQCYSVSYCTTFLAFFRP